MIPTRTTGVVVAAAAALAASACGASSSSGVYVAPSGTITYLEYEYEPAETETECGYSYEYDPISGRYKNVYGCDTYYEAEEECWLVEYESPAGDVYDDCTTEAMWNQLEVGMVYTEGQAELATHTPWLTPSPSPSTSPATSPSASTAAK